MEGTIWAADSMCGTRLPRTILIRLAGLETPPRCLFFFMDFPHTPYLCRLYLQDGEFGDTLFVKDKKTGEVYAFKMSKGIDVD